MYNCKYILNKMIKWHGRLTKQATRAFLQTQKVQIGNDQEMVQSERNGLQKDDMVIFFLWCFRLVVFQKSEVLKMQFLTDGVQTVGVLPYMEKVAILVM